MNQISTPLLSTIDEQGIAVVSSAWHHDIVNVGVRAACEEFERCRWRGRIDRFEVPGAFEIPLLARRLARRRRHGAIIAVGLVVNGGIYRHEFVASAVIEGLMRVQLEDDVPVFSAVLTPRDFHGHDEHLRFFREHFVVKGTEVAQACMRTLGVIQQAAA